MNRLLANIIIFIYGSRKFTELKEWDDGKRGSCYPGWIIFFNQLSGFPKTNSRLYKITGMKASKKILRLTQC